MGYSHGKKGWHVYDVEKREYFVCHDVVFHEGVFLFVEGLERHLGHRDESPNIPDNTIFDDALEEHRRKGISRVRGSDKHDGCKEMRRIQEAMRAKKKHNMVILILLMTREVVMLRIRRT